MYYLHFLLTEPKNKLKSYGESTNGGNLSIDPLYSGGNYALNKNKMGEKGKNKMFLLLTTIISEGSRIRHSLWRRAAPPIRLPKL